MSMSVRRSSARVVRWIVVLLVLAGCGADQARTNYHLAAIAYSPEHQALFIATPASGAIDVLRVAASAAEGGPRFVARLTDARRKHVLRLSVDSKRGRLWAVGPEAIYLHELDQLSLHRVFPIPEAVRGEPFADLVLDRTGNAYVLARGGARIFRIDASTLQLDPWLELSSTTWDRAVYLANRALMSDDDRYLFVVSAVNGGIFKIDLRSKKAQHIELSEPVDLTCGLLFWRDEGGRSPGQQMTALDCLDSWQAQIDLTDEVRGTVRIMGQMSIRRVPAKASPTAGS